MSDPEKEAEQLLPCECSGFDDGLELPVGSHATWCPAMSRHTVAAELKERNDEIARLKRGYDAYGVEGWPCPGCTYHNGKFIAHCQLHTRLRDSASELAAANAKIERLKQVVTVIMGECANLLDSDQFNNLEFLVDTEPTFNAATESLRAEIAQLKAQAQRESTETETVCHACDTSVGGLHRYWQDRALEAEFELAATKGEIELIRAACKDYLDLCQSAQRVAKTEQDTSNQLRAENEWLKTQVDDNYEQGFKFGVQSRPTIDTKWAEYRGGLSYGEFYIAWLKAQLKEGGE